MPKLGAFVTGSAGRAPWRSARWLAGAAVGVSVVLAVAGCSFFTGVEYGPDERPAVANGIDAEVASVTLRSFLIISTAEGESGRFLGTIFNESTEEAMVTFADADEEVTITVPEDGRYLFSENQDGFATVDVRPGARLEMSVTVGTETESINPIILDGGLEQYRSYLPSHTD